MRMVEVPQNIRANSRIDILSSPPFLIGLTVLLLNDLILKYEFTNTLTGKLSDFAGLFIFPLFFSAIFPKYTKAIYGLTIAIFGYWNTSLSQGLIDYFNYSGIHIGRTIDPTDFLAFAILPISYNHFKRLIVKPAIEIYAPLRIAITSITIFSFFATTLPKQSVELGIYSKKTYTLDMSKTALFEKLSPEYSLSDTIELNLVDSLFYLYYYVPDVRADMFVLANITEQNKNTTIRLDSILTGSITGGLISGIDDDDLRTVENIDRSQHEEYFQKYFVDQVRSPISKPSGLFYNNKNIYDEIQIRY